ncbi:MAG TPA: hypothetical protein ENN18_11660 [Proteobacteria bacterium]|nr:hypothetical protein [Pseudomonadota bacterium]
MLKITFALQAQFEEYLRNKVASTTQNQALNALLFFYRHHLKRQKLRSISNLVKLWWLGVSVVNL